MSDLTQETLETAIKMFLRQQDGLGNQIDLMPRYIVIPPAKKFYRQVKTHRRKRINKKYAKKYGYFEVDLYEYLEWIAGGRK